MLSLGFHASEGKDTDMFESKRNRSMQYSEDSGKVRD